MHEKINAFLELLQEEEFFNEKEEEWQFRDGSACGVCTASSMLIAKQFGGTVIGYNCADNRTAEIGLSVTQGHDFALVQERWIVDYWAWRVAALVPKPQFDLNHSADRVVVRRLYGNHLSWSIVENFTAYGKER